MVRPVLEVELFVLGSRLCGGASANRELFKNKLTRLCLAHEKIPISCGNLEREKSSIEK